MADVQNHIHGIQYPAFRGSPNQCQWARSIRLKVIGQKQYTSPSDLDLFKRINDSTWWIANEKALFAGEPFKKPVLDQMVPENPEAELNLGGVSPVNLDALPSTPVKFSVASAQSFAQEVAQYPRLAEVAILVMMARATANVSLKAGLREVIARKMVQCEASIKDEVVRNAETINTLFKQL